MKSQSDRFFNSLLFRILTLPSSRITWLIPHTAPLRLRRILAKIYELGGVHSGAAVSSIIWFAIFTGFLTKEMIDFSTPQWTVKQPAIVTMSYTLLLILLLLALTAYPTARFMAHNTFENVHRWGGWFSLALFWVELVLFAETQKGRERLFLILLKLPAFWFLIISSFHAILPWLRLHKLYVVPEKLSDHAIQLHFREPIPLFVGLRISTAPLREWHSFAAIPAREGKGGSILVSNAGDWTNECINNPREYYWVKGVPVTGVLCMARIFKKIVVVTTGSGIGPVLAVIQDTAQCGTSCRVIWSAAKPIDTFGEGIINSVKAVDPNAIIIDTRQSGRRRPDLVQIAYDIYKKDAAEAVFCISNPKLTKKVVYGLEGRGVPAFGPVWDS
jgi:NAD(P)H-flavin reductase